MRIKLPSIYLTNGRKSKSIFISGPHSLHKCFYYYYWAALQYYVCRRADAAYCHRRSSVVCRSVCHSSKPCKNGWTDRDPARVEDSAGPKYTHNRITALFPGPPAWAGARKLLDFMVLGKVNRGRHRPTDHPAGRHSIRTNQCPPPSSPIFFTGRVPFLPPNQQHQSTEGN